MKLTYKNNSIFRLFLPLFLLFFTNDVFSEMELELLPRSRFTILTLDYTNLLQTGSQDDLFYLRGRFGVDYPLAKLIMPATSVGAGITAAAFINMLPHDMKFAVDNFYATLAIFLTGDYNAILEWRFYPVYHVSAHLADGHPGGITKDKIDAVSSEMVMAEVAVNPIKSLQLSLGFGWYYHVCDQQDLKGRIETGIMYKRAVFNAFESFALLQGESIKQGSWNPGYFASIGIFYISESKKRFGISLCTFNRLHPGYYFRKYEKGWGVNYLFGL